MTNASFSGPGVTASGLAPRLPSRIPSLDGMRAISILAVLLGHLITTHGFPARLGIVGHFSNLGVRCFFVISGFLITTLLLKELDQTGRISLKQFYIRRSIRILPANFFYVAVIVALSLAGIVTLGKGDILHALTYTMNYHPERGWYLNHLWSLSVEEQFYLLWPGILIWATARKAFRVTGVVVLLTPLVRLLLWQAGVGPSGIMRQFEAVCDTLAMGCLLAGTHNRLSADARYMRLLSSRFFLAVPGLALALSSATFWINPGLFYVAGQSLANVGIALFMDRCIRFPNLPAGRLLNSRPVVFVGVISYSLYLWQEPFLNPFSVAWIHSFPYNLIFTVCATLVSYYGIEKPFLRLKPRNPADVRLPQVQS